MVTCTAEMGLWLALLVSLSSPRGTMKSFFCALTTLIAWFTLVLWVVQATKIARSQKGLTWKTIANYLACACLTIGAIGFFGSWLSATGGLNWLPTSFEWPVGTASGVLIKPDGTTIVPHTDSGRVQIYGKDLSFQRGWFVDARGGEFKLSPADGTRFYVFTARGDMKLLYDVDGTLLTQEKCRADEYSGIPDIDDRVSIPTPFYLRVFVSSFASWSVAAIGLFLLVIAGEPRAGKKLERQNSV